MQSAREPTTVRPPLALVYGGGGPYATAFAMGVAAALIEQGVPLRTLPALATSGGAWGAAAVFAGLSHAHVLGVTRRIRLPDLHPGRLLGLAAELFGDRREPLLWTSTLRLPALTRSVMWGGAHVVAEIVAASSAVPLMVAPQRVGRRYYVDGGARSWVSADLAPDADRLLVVAPAVAPAIGIFGPALERQLAFEVRRWRRRTGGEVHVIGPPAQLGRRARRWGDLFDPGLASDAFTDARTESLRELTSERALRAFVFASELSP
jgi:predicted acylesterase/phospholipase RssA